MNACPAIVSVPPRGEQLALAVTDQVTVRLPGPLDGEQVNQPGALLVAVQSQLVPVVTVTVPLAAAALTLAPAAEIE